MLLDAVGGVGANIACKSGLVRIKERIRKMINIRLNKI
jgi:hypothetical protein